MSFDVQHFELKNLHACALISKGGDSPQNFPKVCLLGYNSQIDSNTIFYFFLRWTLNSGFSSTRILLGHRKSEVLIDGARRMNLENMNVCSQEQNRSLRCLWIPVAFSRIPAHCPALCWPDKYGTLTLEAEDPYLVLGSHHPLISKKKVGLI